MLRFHLGLVLNASTRQGDFKELYGLSLAFILTKKSKTTRSGVSELKTAIIILFTVNTVILFNLAPIFCVRQLSCLLQCRDYLPANRPD